uniref:Uncharacterized protein n=1 Tax=Rhizophora mucronata TaxID=61149 RepID=A0A2P2J9M5_RHIMU
MLCWVQFGGWVMRCRINSLKFCMKSIIVYLFIYVKRHLCWFFAVFPRKS